MLEDDERAADALKDLLEAVMQTSLPRLVQQVLPLLSDDAVLRCLTHAIPKCTAGAALCRSIESLLLQR